MSKNPEIPKDSLLSFAGGALAQADDIVKFVTNILGFARIVVEKYRKQSRQKEFRLEQIRELRHEMGALGALTKEMERQSRRGVVYPESIKELSIHVRKANKISREMELRGEDPDFEFVVPPRSSVERIQENESALLVLESLFEEISYYSSYLASHLTD